MGRGALATLAGPYIHKHMLFDTVLVFGIVYAYDKITKKCRKFM